MCNPSSDKTIGEYYGSNACLWTEVLDEKNVRFCSSGDTSARRYQ